MFSLRNRKNIYLTPTLYLDLWELFVFPSVYLHNIKGGGGGVAMDTLSGEATVIIVFASLLKRGLLSKQEEFAPIGNKFFPFRIDALPEDRARHDPVGLTGP